MQFNTKFNMLDSVYIAYQEWNKPIVHGPYTIGCVKLEHIAAQPGLDYTFTNYGPQVEKTEEKYMLVETGIGSGSVWRSDQMFYTYDEALAYAEKFCKEIESEE